ncbi:related to LOG family protein YJL055W [Nakaseomyces glabratus]|nr:related to LOG family protein YJL055W [Nakaseomyces glabratus]
MKSRGQELRSCCGGAGRADPRETVVAGVRRGHHWADGRGGPRCHGPQQGRLGAWDHPDALVAKERSDGGGAGQEQEDGQEEYSEPVNGTTVVSSDYGETTVVPDMHTRKRLMASMSDAFVALPGGFGTLEELLECVTWSQLGIHNKPVVVLNTNGYFDALLRFFQDAIAAGFISEANGSILQVASTPQEAIDLIVNYKVPEGRFNLKWSDEGL